MGRRRGSWPRNWRSILCAGGTRQRAVQYLRYAGEQAVQRSAHQEALVI